MTPTAPVAHISSACLPRHPAVAYLFLVRSMAAVSAYRTLLVVRGCWLLLEWVFGWGFSVSEATLSSLHPYASLFAHAVAVAFVLVILAGLWFFRRWARFIFVLLLALAVVYSVFRQYQPASVPPEPIVAIMWLMVMLNGVIVAMSFLPPVRDMFSRET